MVLSQNHLQKLNLRRGGVAVESGDGSGVDESAFMDFA